MFNSMLLKEAWGIFCLSIMNVLILPPLCFSTNALNILKASQAYDFCFRKYTKAFLLNSLVKEIKYSQVTTIRCWYFNWTQVWMNYFQYFLIPPRLSGWTEKLLEIVYLDSYLVKIPTPCSCRYFNWWLWQKSLHIFFEVEIRRCLQNI